MIKIQADQAARDIHQRQRLHPHAVLRSSEELYNQRYRNQAAKLQQELGDAEYCGIQTKNTRFAVRGNRLTRRSLRGLRLNGRRDKLLSASFQQRVTWNQDLLQRESGRRFRYRT